MTREPCGRSPVVEARVLGSEARGQWGPDHTGSRRALGPRRWCTETRPKGKVGESLLPGKRPGSPLAVPGPDSRGQC